MKKVTLLFVVLTFFSCNKLEKECIEYVDITGRVLVSCCAYGPWKEKKNCKCIVEWGLENSTMTEKEKKEAVKEACN